jgi:Helix-turn-helix domain
LAKGSRITGAQRTTLASRYAKRYAAGESIRKIADDVGRSFGFVHGVLKESVSGGSFSRPSVLWPLVSPKPFLSKAFVVRQSTHALVARKATNNPPGSHASAG